MNVPFLAESTKYDHYLIEVPVTIMVPEDLSLVWLGPILNMQSSEPQTPRIPILPYSLFPTTEFKEKDWDIGGLNLDTAEALSALLDSSQRR